MHISAQLNTQCLPSSSHFSELDQSTGFWGILTLGFFLTCLYYFRQSSSKADRTQVVADVLIHFNRIKYKLCDFSPEGAIIQVANGFLPVGTDERSLDSCTKYNFNNRLQHEKLWRSILTVLPWHTQTRAKGNCMTLNSFHGHYLQRQLPQHKQQELLNTSWPLGSLLFDYFSRVKLITNTQKYSTK